MESSNYILEMENISKSFPGVKALDNVTFSVKYGEVMGLIGENGAGKSTLMKVLLGLYQQDSGSIRYKGEEYSVKSPHDALVKGISMIHQELSLVPTMTVGENIWLGQEKKYLKFGFINKEKRDRAAERLLKSLGITQINTNQEVSRLSVAKMQLVEIARTFSYNSNIVIMDEPTSSLTDYEIEMLHELITKLKNDGVSIIFISHKLDEVLSFCDRATILRDGQFIDTLEVSQTSTNDLVRLMVGRKINNIYPTITKNIRNTYLEVENFNKTGVFQDISFSIKRGEVVGFCGLIGSGRTEIAKAIFGLDKKDSGNIRIDGKPVNITCTKDAISFKIGMINEDRLRLGIINRMSLKGNVSIAYIKSICRGMFVKNKQENKDVSNIINTMTVKHSSQSQPIETLSGGNQQKAIISRWLLTKPKILILDEPTRGIDVGSKYEIYKLINELAEQGLAIMLISSELQELVGISHRIIVIREGKQVFEVDREKFDQQTMMKYAFGAQGKGIGV